jgi:hypothetical protein
MQRVKTKIGAYFAIDTGHCVIKHTHTHTMDIDIWNHHPPIYSDYIRRGREGNWALTQLLLDVHLSNFYSPSETCTNEDDGGGGGGDECAVAQASGQHSTRSPTPLDGKRRITEHMQRGEPPTTTTTDCSMDIVRDAEPSSPDYRPSPRPQKRTRRE